MYGIARGEDDFMTKHFVDPLEELLKNEAADQLLRFFTLAEERLTLAFPRASSMLAESSSPSAKQVRGTTRRHYLHEALATAARDADLEFENRWTDPATWSFPVVRSGGFSMTIGIVDTRFRGSGRTLRTTSQYVADLCERNVVVNPQGGLFDGIERKDVVIPRGSLGALIVAQYSPTQPDAPAFLGFWVPSPDLSEPYYVRSFEQVIAALREHLALGRRPSKRVVERKAIKLRKKPDKKA
jgi:hypothetical protein